MNLGLRTPRHVFAGLLTARVCGLSLLVCAVGLIAVVVSDVSSVDDSVQPDLSNHIRTVRGIGTTSKLLTVPRKPNLQRPNVAITFGDPARGISVDAVLDLLPRLSLPGVQHSLAARAPPVSSPSIARSA